MAEGVRLLPVARVVPALTALSLVAPVCASLIGYEAIRYREGRAWIRSRRGAFTMEEAADAGRSREGDGRPHAGRPHDAAGRRISAVLVQVADLLGGLAVVPSQGSTG